MLCICFETNCWHIVKVFPSIPGCNFVLSESSGNFSTTDDINTYFSYKYCSFLVKPQGANKIYLRFPYLRVSGNSYINIYSGLNASAPLLTTLNKKDKILNGPNTSFSIDASSAFIKLYKASFGLANFKAVFFTSTGRPSLFLLYVRFLAHSRMVCSRNSTELIGSSE